MFHWLKEKRTKLRHNFLSDRRAIESMEIAIIAAAVILVVFGAFQFLGVKITDVINQVANAI